MPERRIRLSPDEQRGLWPDNPDFGWITGQVSDQEYTTADIERMRQGGWVDFAIGQLLGTGLRVPVGPPIDRRDTRVGKVLRLPTVVPGPRGPGLGGIFGKASGGSFPQIKEVLPVPTAIPIPVLPTVRTGPSTEVGGPNSTNIDVGARNMPDLGSIFEGHFGLPGWEGLADLGAGLLGWAGSPPVATIPSPAPAPVLVETGPRPPGGGGMPTMGGGGGCERDPRNDYVLKFICGQWKWVKKRKRRSKRLATASDIKDLSALQGVLGNGKNLTTWIATHR